MKGARIHVFCDLDVTPLLLLLLMCLNILCAAVSLFALWDLSGRFWTLFEIGTIFFLFFFFFSMLDQVLCTYVSLAPVICLPGELSFHKLSSQKSPAGLEYVVVELSWEIWFKWVALISCGNLSGTRGKKCFGDLCSSSSSEKLFSHLVTKTWGTNLSVKGCGEGGGLLCLEIQRVWDATGVDRRACAQMRFRSVW